MQWMQQAVSKLVGQYSPGPQQQKGMLSKEQLTKFFTASTDLLETAAVKKELKTAADQGQDPEEIITDLQKELFKAQGIDGVFGIECLGQVGDAYQDDTDFMRLFVSSVEREEEAVNEAELSPEEFQIRKERMKAMREQNDALVAQMEGMSHEEQQHFLTAQVKERVNPAIFACLLFWMVSVRQSVYDVLLCLATSCSHPYVDGDYGRRCIDADRAPGLYIFVQQAPACVYTGYSDATGCFAGLKLLKRATAFAQAAMFERHSSTSSRHYAQPSQKQQVKAKPLSS